MHYSDLTHSAITCLLNGRPWTLVDGTYEYHPPHPKTYLPVQIISNGRVTDISQANVGNITEAAAATVPLSPANAADVTAPAAAACFVHYEQYHFYLALVGDTEEKESVSVPIFQNKILSNQARALHFFKIEKRGELVVHVVPSPYCWVCVCV